MFHKKTLLTLLVFTLVLGAGITATSAFSGKWNGENKPNFDPEKHEAVQAALETGDYNTWLESVPENCPMTEKITEENFDRFVQLHELKQTGDMEAAKALAEELGLPGKRGMHKFGRFMGERKFEDKNGDGFCDKMDLEVE